MKFILYVALRTLFKHVIYFNNVLYLIYMNIMIFDVWYILIFLYIFIIVFNEYHYLLFIDHSSNIIY